MFTSIRKRDWAIVAISLAVFVFALTQPAFRTIPPYEFPGEVVDPVTGDAFGSFLLGWTLIPVAIIMMFLPNPTVGILTIAALLLVRYTRPVLAIAVGCVAVVLATRSTTLGTASWLGNPVLFASWCAYLLRRRRLSFLLAVIAAGLMLEFLTIKDMPFGLKEAEIPIQEYDIGYWAWIASAVVMAVAALPTVLMHRFRNQHGKEPSVS